MTSTILTAAHYTHREGRAWECTCGVTGESLSITEAANRADRHEATGR